ncbi:MAG: histone deacetylase family protein [Hyphomicrobiaceae bacterium]
MKVFFSDAQLAHAPQQFMVAGRFVAPFEVPERARTLARRFQSMGLEVLTPKDHGRTPIEAIHPPHYLDFLESAYARFRELPGAGPEGFPNVHPHLSAMPALGARERPRPQSIVGQFGWYVGDMACAIGEGTWRAAYASAQAAIGAAEAVLAGEREALALCRPPGHHAYQDRASGFCFLNNAAIATEVLRRRFQRVAVLDFDTHHGDGTQAIFFQRPDVFVGSAHTDPSNYYPFFTGYREETGFGAGDKSNLNIPLPPGSDDETFYEANQKLIVAALAFGADALVISAGWDAHRDDPLSKLQVTTDAFRRLGRLYGELPFPTVIMQEGGYSIGAIETVAPLFVSEFLDERRVV